MRSLRSMPGNTMSAEDGGLGQSADLPACPKQRPIGNNRQGLIVALGRIGMSASISLLHLKHTAGSVVIARAQAAKSVRHLRPLSR